MNENFEQKSTETLESSAGGLVLMLTLFAPILIIIGISKAVTSLANGPESINRG